MCFSNTNLTKFVNVWEKNPEVLFQTLEKKKTLHHRFNYMDFCNVIQFT